MLPEPAISFSEFQNASSRLTLVLWLARTTDRFTTRDFIYAPNVIYAANVAVVVAWRAFPTPDGPRLAVVHIKMIPEENLCGHYFTGRSRTIAANGLTVGRYAFSSRFDRTDFVPWQ
jgi:hypothetical protein